MEAVLPNKIIHNNSSMYPGTGKLKRLNMCNEAIKGIKIKKRRFKGKKINLLNFFDHRNSYSG